MGCALRTRSLAGRHQAGTVKNEIFAALDWVPTWSTSRRRQGRCLEQAHHGRSYPGIVKTKLDGVDQTEYLAGRSEKSHAIPSSTIPARTHRRSATRTGRSTSRWSRTTCKASLPACSPTHWAQVVNISGSLRDVARLQVKTLMGQGRHLAHPPLPTSTIGTCCRSARRFG